MIEIRNGGEIVGVERAGVVTPAPSKAGQLLAGWLVFGAPGIAGVQDGDVITEQIVTISPDAPLFGLALIEAIEAQGWTLAEVYTADKAYCPTGPGGGQDNSCPPWSVGKLSGVEFTIGTWNQELPAAKAAKKLIAMMEEAALAGDTAKLYELGAELEALNPEDADKYDHAMMLAYMELQNVAKANKLNPPEKAKVEKKEEGVLSSEGWTKTGGQLGTEIGGVYKGPDGKTYYVKTPTDPGRARNEVLAAKLYAAAGANIPATHLLEIDGKLSVAREWVEADKADWSNPDHKAAAAEDFAIHALTANWDAVGAGTENPMDNIRIDANGKAVSLDVGGALDYKGMGGAGKKEFTKEADEWHTMRDPSINPSAAKVFGAMTEAQLESSVGKLHNLSNATIHELAAKYGNPEIADKLIARRNAILAKAPSQGKTEIHPDTSPAPAPEAIASPTPTPSKFKDAPAIPPPPVLHVLGEGGKKWNTQKKIDEIYAAAMTGDIKAVEAVKTNATSTSTYSAKHHAYKMAVLEAMKAGGKPNPDHVTQTPPPAAAKPAKPSAPKPPKPPKAAPPPPAPPKIDPSKFPPKPDFISSQADKVAANKAAIEEMHAHATKGDVAALKAMTLTPSPKVQEHHKALLANLHAQLNPPPPPKPLSEGYLKAIEHVKGPITKEERLALSKVGLYAVRGNLGGLPVDLPVGKPFNPDGDPDLWAAGVKAWKSLSTADQVLIKNYTDDYYKSWNHAIRSGTAGPTSDAMKNAKAMMKAAIPIPPATRLSRFYHVDNRPGHLGELKVGMVISDAATMSTSTKDHTKSLGKSYSSTSMVVLDITVGHGVRQLPVDSFSANPGEKEYMTLPNQRMLVTGINPNGVVSVVMLPSDDAQCCPP